MVAEVIIDISTGELDRVFDYTAREDTELGQRVAVPFGKARKEGFVIGLKEKSDFASLKEIEYPLDDFIAITPEQLSLMNEICFKYHLRKVDVLRLFIPSKLRSGQVGDIILKFASLTDTVENILEKLGTRAPKQIECVKHLAQKGDFTVNLNKLFGTAAVNALQKKGFIEFDDVKKRRKPLATERGGTVNLNADQKAAVDAVVNGSGIYLLHGVTGSGKTEVYMHAIENALERGKTAIMLVPEISLTPQVLGLFRARFGDEVAIIHSGLSDGERYDEWKRLLLGEAKIAVGARSAVFAPLQNIGIIILDEEHDGSYISERNPRYDTREIAEMRAKYNEAPLILGSATPLIESYYRTQSGEIKLLEMPHRIKSLELPEMEIVDMTTELRRGNRDAFSKQLKDALKQTLDRGEQALLFLNRRGYFSYVMCRECGYIAKCPNCDVSMTYHKTERKLVCHCCGHKENIIFECPNCGSTEIRQGHIGTEQLAEAVNKMFPKARVLRMDNDTTRAKGGHQTIVDAFASGDADVLVGTQMIAKGHDFKKVTLVGILETDYSLYLSDYRSTERTFQLVTQVAGRAGRDALKGRVILQTYSPDHYVFKYASAYDYNGFYKKELNSREVTGFPPFSKIVRVLISDKDDMSAKATSRAIYDALHKLEQENIEDFLSFKGMKSPIERVQNMYRYQILMRLKVGHFDELIQRIYTLSDENKNKQSTVFVEINPQNFN